MRKLAACTATTLFLLLSAAPAQAVAPANDSFANATALPSVLFSEETTVTTDATTEIDEPVTNSCVTGDAPADDSVAKTVWYKFVMDPATAVNIAFDTFGSVSTDDAYDTVIVLWKGTTLNNLVEVACSDDSGPDFASHSRVGSPLKGPATYYIQVGSWTGLDDNLDPIAPDTGTLHVHGNPRVSLPGVVRQGTDQWFLNTGDNAVESFEFGTPQFDVPLVGTTTGDGISKPVIRNVNVWFLNFWFDDSPEAAFTHASATDFPLVGDWEGDTLASPGVVRGNTWFLSDSTDGSLITFKHGLSTDYPVAGDWDGDGTETPGLIRGNKWFVSNQVPPTSVTSFTFASATDFPIVGDWDGDGSMSPGVVRGNTWYLSNTTPPTAIISSFAFAKATDFPIAGDWDGAVTGLGVGGSSTASAKAGKSSGPPGPFRWAT